MKSKMQWNSGAPASAANFWVNLKCCSAEFHIASKHSEDLLTVILGYLWKMGRLNEE